MTIVTRWWCRKQKQNVGIEPFSVCALTLPLTLIITSDEEGLAAAIWSIYREKNCVGQQYLAAVQLHCQQWLNFDIDLNVYFTFVWTRLNSLKLPCGLCHSLEPIHTERKRKREFSLMPEFFFWSLSVAHDLFRFRSVWMGPFFIVDGRLLPVCLFMTAVVWVIRLINLTGTRTTDKELSVPKFY